MNPPIELRDIHLPPEPSWWPPAPGWWLLALVLLALLAWSLRASWRVRQARMRTQAMLAQFEMAARLQGHEERLAAISQLLRRAARLRDPASAALQGEAWLQFLDGRGRMSGKSAEAGSARVFSAGVGRVLLDGPYRPKVDAAQAQAVVGPARERFLNLVQAP